MNLVIKELLDLRMGGQGLLAVPALQGTKCTEVVLLMFEQCLQAIKLSLSIYLLQAEAITCTLHHDHLTLKFLITRRRSCIIVLLLLFHHRTHHHSPHSKLCSLQILGQQVFSYL